MRDRACQGGGWNFGNGEVYGQGLPAHVPPTAIGVLAMQDRPTTSLVVDAVQFLEEHAQKEGSTTALALSTLGLGDDGTARVCAGRSARGTRRSRHDVRQRRPHGHGRVRVGLRHQGQRPPRAVTFPLEHSA